MIEYTFYFFEKMNAPLSRKCEITVTTHCGFETAKEMANDVINNLYKDIPHYLGNLKSLKVI